MATRVMRNWASTVAQSLPTPQFQKKLNGKQRNMSGSKWTRQHLAAVKYNSSLPPVSSSVEVLSGNFGAPACLVCRPAQGRTTGASASVRRGVDMSQSSLRALSIWRGGVLECAEYFLEGELHLCHKQGKGVGMERIPVFGGQPSALFARFLVFPS